MKKLAFAFIVLALLSSACGPSKKDITQLEQIETMAVENPDSAIALLDSLPCSALRNREFRSRATIAEAEAMYQNSEIMGKDSLLADAIDFYRLREKDPRRYRAYFLSGYQHYLKKEYGEAIIDYLNAEHTAALTTDTLALGLIYRAIANTFFRLENFTSSLDYYNKSFQQFKKAKPNKYYWESRIDLAKAYYNAFFYDESLNLLLDTANYYAGYNTIQECYINRLIAQCYEGKKDYAKAKKYYSLLELNYKDYLTCQDYRYMGHIAFNLGEYDKTEFYNRQLSNCDSTDKWLDYLISLKNNNHKKALDILRNEYNSSNDYFIEQSKSDFSSLIHSYYQAQFRETLLKKESIKTRSILISVCSSLTIFFIALTFFLYHRKQTKDRDNKIHIIQGLSEIIRLKNEQIDNLEKKSLKKQVLYLPIEFNTLEILCNNYFTYQDSPSIQKRTYKQIIEIFRKLQTGGNELKSLIDFINNKMDNLFTRFLEENQNINKAEEQLFLFMLLGLSPTSISVLQDVSVNQIYSRKTYLKSKIKKNQGASMDEILSYF